MALHSMLPDWLASTHLSVQPTYATRTGCLETATRGLRADVSFNSLPCAAYGRRSDRLYWPLPAFPPSNAAHIRDKDWSQGCLGKKKSEKDLDGFCKFLMFSDFFRNETNKNINGKQSKSKNHSGKI